MRLYLVQHGEAKTKDVDPERRLTDNGVRDVEKMAAFVRPLGLRVKAVWHSGKRRAAQTADILGAALIAAESVVQRDGLAPNHPVGPVRDELAQAAEDLMIVGHLPFLARLSSALVAGSESADVVAFQQGGVLCVERGDGGVLRVRWMVIPELL